MPNKTTAARRTRKRHASSDAAARADLVRTLRAAMHDRLNKMAADPDLFTNDQRVRGHGYLLTQEMVRAVC
jgi:hypothetical protein